METVVDPDMDEVDDGVEGITVGHALTVGVGVEDIDSIGMETSANAGDIPVHPDSEKLARVRKGILDFRESLARERRETEMDDSELKSLPELEDSDDEEPSNLALDDDDDDDEDFSNFDDKKGENVSDFSESKN